MPRRQAVAIDDCGDQACTPGATGAAFAELCALLGADTDLGHGGKTPRTLAISNPMSMGSSPGTWGANAERRAQPLSLRAGYASYATPPNRSVTEPSEKTARMALAKSGAIESTVKESNCDSGAIGSVLGTTTSLIAEFFSRSTAGPLKTA